MKKDIDDEDEPPVKRARRCSIVEDSQDKEIDKKEIVIKSDDKIISKPVCPGCFPIFQENQLGHYGPNGCLGDEFTLDDSSK